MSAAEAPVRAGRYDPALRRRAVRRGRERGCWVYISAEELTKAGRGGDGPPPFYRIFGGSRGGVVVQLYRER